MGAYDETANHNIQDGGVRILACSGVGVGCDKSWAPAQADS